MTTAGRLGSAPREPLFRDDCQLGAVDGADRRATADRAADGERLHRRWSAWFDYFGGDLTALAETEKLRGIASVEEIGSANGESPLPENQSVDVDRVISLRRSGSSQVREMSGEAASTP